MATYIPSSLAKVGFFYGSELRTLVTWLHVLFLQFKYLGCSPALGQTEDIYLYTLEKESRIFKTY